MKDELKDNRIYFRHIIDAIERIERYTEDGKEEFLESEMIQNAVIWNIGVIGEAVRQVSNWLKESHPDIPWQQMISMRNRLVHEYFNINPDLVWEVVETHLPLFKAQAQAILKELG
jgi:uncharacterized protein with HEPN domain